MNCGYLYKWSLKFAPKQTLWKSAESSPEAPCGLDDMWVRTALRTRRLPMNTASLQGQWSPHIWIQSMVVLYCIVYNVPSITSCCEKKWCRTVPYFNLFVVREATDSLSSSARRQQDGLKLVSFICLNLFFCLCLCREFSQPATFTWRKPSSPTEGKFTNLWETIPTTMQAALST